MLRRGFPEQNVSEPLVLLVLQILQILHARHDHCAALVLSYQLVVLRGWERLQLDHRMHLLAESAPQQLLRAVVERQQSVGPMLPHDESVEPQSMVSGQRVGRLDAGH